MQTAWSTAHEVAADRRRERTVLALETVVARARTGTFFYPLVTLLCLPLVGGRACDLVVTCGALAVQLALAGVRFALYRRTAAARRADPDRWRLRFAVLAATVIVAWDLFAAVEIWMHPVDATRILLMTASVVLRTSGMHATAPDLAFHAIWGRWTRVPLIAVALWLGTAEGVVMAAVLAIHAVYAERQVRSLNAEFWDRIAANEALAAAHAELQREVAMRERAESQLRLAQKLESVGRLAAGIAHEINSPLQAIGGSIQFLAEGTDEVMAVVARHREALTPEERAAVDDVAACLPESIALAQDCLARAASIVASIKTFAHPQLASPTAVDVNHALETTLAIARHEYASVADVRTALGDVPAVAGYAGELGQVFLNLIINAVHAMEPVQRDTGRRGTLAIATRRADAFVEIAIADTGTGIPEAIRDRIFDPFFTTKELGKGTGQGLALAHAVVTQRHGGEIRVASTVGAGTEFTIRLPIAA